MRNFLNLRNHSITQTIQANEIFSLHYWWLCKAFKVNFTFIHSSTVNFFYLSKISHFVKDDALHKFAFGLSFFASQIDSIERVSCERPLRCRCAAILVLFSSRRLCRTSCGRLHPISKLLCNLLDHFGKRKMKNVHLENTRFWDLTLEWLIEQS